MKTLVTIVGSSVLGFAVVFLCVPRRDPDSIPPTWFELPGQPLSVDGQPTRTWQEVNQALQRASNDLFYSEEWSREPRAPELQGPRVRITYLPAGRGAGRKAIGVETVTVRMAFPAAVPWSRANNDSLVRYEVERANTVE